MGQLTSKKINKTYLSFQISAHCSLSSATLQLILQDSPHKNQQSQDKHQKNQ